MKARVSQVFACTLDASGRAQRGDEWRALGRDALIDVHEEGGVVTSSWRRDTEIERRLEELVDAERICCSFLDFDLDRQEDTLVLRVASPDGMEAAARL